MDVRAHTHTHTHTHTHRYFRLGARKQLAPSTSVKFTLFELRLSFFIFKYPDYQYCDSPAVITELTSDWPTQRPEWTVFMCWMVF